MKKIMALVLAIALALSLSVSAFAAQLIVNCEISKMVVNNLLENAI